MMKRLATLPVLALALGACSSDSATAPRPIDSPRLAVATTITQTGGLRFVGQPEVNPTSDGLALTATGEVTGAGPTATATLSADVALVTGCINPGSKQQQPKGLQRTSITTTASEEFPTRAGRASFTLTTEPVTTDRSCPGKDEVTIVSTSFSNVTLTVTSQTGTTTATF